MSDPKKIASLAQEVHSLLDRGVIEKEYPTVHNQHTFLCRRGTVIPYDSEFEMAELLPKSPSFSHTNATGCNFCLAGWFPSVDLQDANFHHPFASAHR